MDEPKIPDPIASEAPPLEPPACLPWVNGMTWNGVEPKSPSWAEG
jgi:hypothetical protein